jgi:hypothetical protein
VSASCGSPHGPSGTGPAASRSPRSSSGSTSIRPKRSASWSWRPSTAPTPSTTGQAENAIKDFKRALAGDRLSCTTYVANTFRLFLRAVAYRLLDALRRVVVRVAPCFGRRQFDTLRLLLLKVAALVGQSVRRVTLQLPAAFPMAEVFAAVARAIGATLPRAA